MRSSPRLGAANLALLSIYFAPVWGRDALHVMTSLYGGLEDPVQAAAAVYFRHLFGFSLGGLIWTSNVLASIKLMMAAAFFAYGIEFARSLAAGRDVNRETADMVLVLAIAGVGMWALPVMTLDHDVPVRILASQLLLVLGAIVVTVIERQVELSQSATIAQSDRRAGGRSPGAIRP